MNNVIFGNNKFSHHYETLGGGSGARIGQEAPPLRAGTHMTNTAITDPEILENRFPVRLVADFRRRIGSGGEGSWSGGGWD